MIKKLRIRIVVTMMSVVALLLLVMFGLIFKLTERRLREENVRIMENIARSPFGEIKEWEPGERLEPQGPGVGHGGGDASLPSNSPPGNRAAADKGAEAPSGNRAPADRGAEAPPENGERGLEPEKRDRGWEGRIRVPFFRILLDQDGQILAKAGNYYELEDDESLSSLASAALSSGSRVGVLREYGLRFLKDAYHGSFHRDEGYGSATDTLVFSDISGEIGTMRSLLGNCLLIGCLSFLLFLLPAVFFARWSVKPLETAWNQQRQFVSDASHELKTPLTVILTDAELMKSALGEGSYPRAGRYAENILSMSRQMRGLVESLLRLARTDRGGIAQAESGKEKESVDLSRMVSDELLGFEAMFFEKGLLLEEDIEDGLYVHGISSQLQEAVEILLDNARKYADGGTSVRVSLKKGETRHGGRKQKGGHVLLSVTNEGNEIPQGELKNIFKRFYRLDEARAMNHSYGLGLSIAENIVRSHDGRIWAESGDGKNTFRIELPAMQGKLRSQ